MIEPTAGPRSRSTAATAHPVAAVAFALRTSPLLSSPFMGIHQWRHGAYTISTDPRRFDVDVFHRYLSEKSYWAAGRLRETTDHAVANSMVFGAYTSDGTMVGAARVVTDGVTFGWLCDLFVLDAHRGVGLGKALAAAVSGHPELAELKRFMLATVDAHRLYESYGFAPVAAPERWMERSGTTV